MTISAASGLGNDSKDIEMLDSFCLLGTTIKHQVKYHRLALDSITIKALEKIFICCDRFMPIDIRMTQGIIFLVTLFGSKSWISKKQYRENIDTLEC